MRKILLATSASIITCLSVGAIQAQDADDGANNTIEELIVTARKREETIQDIPLAITAFDSNAIQDLGLESIIDLPRFTPGFEYESFQGIPGRFDNSPRFRGVGINTIAATRQTASVFVDGVYIIGGARSIGLGDVERVEIIKGPQSAFFGRNTFGGAINYVTRTPDDEVGGTISALAATRGQYSFDGSLEGPLGGGLKGRVNFSTKEKGGHYTSAVDGGELGQESTDSFSASLYWELADNFNAKVRFSQTKDDDGSPAFSAAGLAFHNCGPFSSPGVDDMGNPITLTGTDTTICGEVPVLPPSLNTNLSAGAVPTIINNLNNQIPLVSDGNRTEFGLDRDAKRYSAQFNYDFANSITLSGLFGLNNEVLRLFRDADDSGDEAFFSYSNRKFEDNSQELRLSGLALNDQLNWSLGINRYEQEFANNGGFIIPAFGGGVNAGPPAYEFIETQGIFGSVDYAFNDQWSVNLEGRSQNDKIFSDGNTTNNSTTDNSNVEFTNFLPRAIVEFTPSADSLYYTSYSVGNLPGGFNGDVAVLDEVDLENLRMIQETAGPTFEEEELRNLEFGWKQSFLDNRASITTAAFFMDRINQTFRRSDRILDLSTPDPLDTKQIDYLINAGESEIKGLEFEGDFQVNDLFSLSGSFAYIDGEFVIFNSGNIAEVFGSPDASGKKTDRFPKWSGALSTIFNGTVNAELDWFGRADILYTGERFADELNLATAPAGTQINIRAGVESDDYRLELFVTNLTDDDTPTAINRFRDLSNATPLFDFSTFAYEVGLRDRRQLGLKFTYSY